MLSADNKATGFHIRYVSICAQPFDLTDELSRLFLFSLVSQRLQCL